MTISTTPRILLGAAMLAVLAATPVQAGVKALVQISDSCKLELITSPTNAGQVDVVRQSDAAAPYGILKEGSDPLFLKIKKNETKKDGTLVANPTWFVFNFEGPAGKATDFDLCLRFTEMEPFEAAGAKTLAATAGIRVSYDKGTKKFKCENLNIHSGHNSRRRDVSFPSSNPYDPAKNDLFCRVTFLGD